MTALVDAMTTRTRALSLLVQSATPMRRAIISFAAGALSVLAMAPFFLSPILLLTLPVLVWLIDRATSGPQVHDRPDARSADTTSDTVRTSKAGNTKRWFDKPAVKQAALAGWLFGFGYFVFGMFWIGEAFLVEAEKFAWLLPAAVTLLPAGLAVFFAIAAALASVLWRPGFSRVFVLASAIGLTEGVRGHIFTGLPWNTLGYALTWPMTLMQSAGLVGVNGLTVLVVIAFAGPLVVLADQPRSNERASSLRATLAPFQGWVLGGMIVATLWAYGTYRLMGDTDARVPNVKLRIVQPSVPQREKWLPEKQREIFDLHVDLTRRNPAGVVDDLKGITHVIWPEAAMPFLPLDSPQALKEIGELLPDDVYLISGALRVEWPNSVSADATSQDGTVPRSTNENAQVEGTNAPEPGAAPATQALSSRRAFNSLMAFGPEGGLIAVYDKIHLVPFGEYLPFQGFLESIGLEQLTRIRGGFTSGRQPRPLIDVPKLPTFIGLVCYEAIFPGAIVQGTERPNLIINVTNDGWFGNTTGPRQHFHMTRVRAVEEGLPLIRVANNGISAVLNAYGRTIARIELDQRGVEDSTLPIPASSPLYEWFGEKIYILYILSSLVWFAGSSLASRKRG